MAQFIYLKPVEEHSDEEFVNVFRCNSTLENENTLYNVHCRYLSGDTKTKTRTEDATIPCLKILGEEQGTYAGVSQNSYRDTNRFQIKSLNKIRMDTVWSSEYRSGVPNNSKTPKLPFSANWVHNGHPMQWHN